MNQPIQLLSCQALSFGFSRMCVCVCVRARARALLILLSLVAVTSEPQHYLFRKGSHIFSRAPKLTNFIQMIPFDHDFNVEDTGIPSPIS